MLNPAVFCLFALLLILTGCTGTEAKIHGRACSVGAAPVSAPEPIVEATVANQKPVVITQQKTMTLEVSAYSSSIEETDSTPCIAADNSDICRRKAAGELICASNAFPLGARIHVDGLGTCAVADRMNSRYTSHVDWYVLDKKTARKIGRKARTITVVSR